MSHQRFAVFGSSLARHKAHRHKGPILQEPERVSVAILKRTRLVRYPEHCTLGERGKYCFGLVSLGLGLAYKYISLTEFRILSASST